MPMFNQMGLIGCGLMGGSLALALKQAGLVRSVVGFSQSPSSSAKALALGVIDQQALAAGEVAKGSDLIVLAMPVAATANTLALLKPQLEAHTLIVDLGSTKESVVQAAEQALAEKASQFVGCHPMAGAEKSGVEHAYAQLYARCQVLITPAPSSQPERLAQARQLWEALGCKVVSLSPTDHDRALAKVSHLPHLLAFAFINGLLGKADSSLALALAGTGFKDFSRIAASEPHMWRDILLANREPILNSLADFEQALAQLKSALVTDDHLRLFSLIDQASTGRQAWRANVTE